MSDTLFQITATLVFFSGLINLTNGWLGGTVPLYSSGVTFAVARFLISNPGRVFTLILGFLAGIIGAAILFEYLSLQIFGIVETVTSVTIILSGMTNIAIALYDSLKPFDLVARVICTLIGLVTGFIGLMLLLAAIFGYI